MACWLTSYNLDFADIPAQICVAKGVETPKSRSESYTPLPVAGEKETARFETPRMNTARNWLSILAIH